MSPLLDQRGFVAELERHYRDIWRAWCERGNEASNSPVNR